MSKNLNANFYKRNLKLVMFESAITAGLISMSVMSPFFLSIGLTQSEIALSQSIFTIFMVVLNVPTGWLADRFGRKWANVIGDIGHAIVLLLYARAQTFFDVVLCETLAALFLSFSKGVDLSLLKHFSQKISPEEKVYRYWATKLAVLQNACALILVFLGGPIGAISFRLAIASSSVPYILGGIASFFIHDDSERLVAKYRNPLYDMGSIVKSSFTNPALRLRILAYAVGRQMTHGIIWVFTPILLYVGIPLPIVSSMWALNSLSSIIGAKMAARFSPKMHDWQIFLVPLMLMTISMAAMSCCLNRITVWLYLLMGVTQGWTSATMSPMVQRYTQMDSQTSVLSFASVVSHCLYIPVIWIIGKVADINLRLTTLITLIIFAILGIFVLARLLREQFNTN